ncbi:MAG: efflux RND transporter periplasmic adaptor subunit, partial [Planctomycetia bacterium]|nr:efflux RND transporter periplasmic adaptor subunit [Planctomycetia bacterium]
MNVFKSIVTNARRHLIILGVAAAVLVGLVLMIVWWPKATGEGATGSEVWTCSMHPQIRLPQPGSCPICGMPLTPTSKLAEKKGDEYQHARLETQAVARRELFKEIQTVGKIDYNESRVEFISARIAGRVDRLYVDFTGIEVKENDHLVDIYSPELYSAQAELIGALEASESLQTRPAGLGDRFTEANLLASREKLRLWGLLPEQIAEIEKTRKHQTHVTIYSPLAGTVIAKNVRLGQYIKEGDPLYRIAELDPIWLYLELYEYDIASVHYGQPVDVALEAFPGETFRGIVTFIDPFLDDRTRTVKVRVNLKNPDRKLKAGMYASATIRVRLLGNGVAAPTGLEGKFSCPMHPEVIQIEAGKCPICKMGLIQIPPGSPFTQLDGQARAAHADGEKSPEHAEHAADATTTKETTEVAANPLAIPASAVLDTGRRQIAYRATKEGNYELVELQVGSLATATDEAGHTTLYYPVLSGLNEGDHVVVRGGFLLDSQTQIEGRPSLLFPKGQTGASGQAMSMPMSMPM